MVYLIIDVHYQNTNEHETATVAGIRFQGIEKNHVLSTHTVSVDNVAPYQSGQFYKREMPCILALLASIATDEPYDVIIIDGYVYLDGMVQEGLGKYLYDYLYDNLTVNKPIMGIAKNKFINISDDYAVHRGMSKKPLYVTSIGFGNEVDSQKDGKVDHQQAMQLVQNLAGEHRLPLMVSQVDRLCRKYNTALVPPP